MPPIRVFVASRDGESERIARHLASRLLSRGIGTLQYVLPLAFLSRDLVMNSSMIVVVASVRFGRHLPEAESFLAKYASIRLPPPLALASVNLGARKVGRRSRHDNPYLRRVIRRFQLNPALAYAVAGRLDYARYPWPYRVLMRVLKFMIGKADADTVEYTNWEDVEHLSDEIVMLFEGSLDHRTSTYE